MCGWLTEEGRRGARRRAGDGEVDLKQALFVRDLDLARPYVCQIKLFRVLIHHYVRGLGLGNAPVRLI
jgi:hypothetical protein